MISWIHENIIGLIEYGFIAGITLGLIQLWISSKSFKRIFAPCQQCQFKPDAVALQNPTDGSWHQVQECERCGRKRDVVLSQSNLEAAQKFFFGQEQP